MINIKTIKRVLIRCVVFLLVLSMSVPIISKREERSAEAVALVDDLLIGMCITAITLTYGYLSRHNDKGAVEAFTDAFGGDTLENVKRFIKAVDINEAAVSLLGIKNVSPDLAKSVSKIKSMYKYPAQELPDGRYLAYDESGNIVEYADYDDFISCGHYAGKFYLVESVNDVPFTVDTSGKYVITDDVFSDIKNALTTLSKPVVKLGKTILDDIVDIRHY